MARNAYTSLRRLATHPAFSMRTGTLVCRECGKEFGCMKDHDDHYLAHDPTDEEAARRISGKRWDREQKKRPNWRAWEEIEAARASD